MSDCIFCKIAAGEIPCSKVYEDDDYIAFLDIAPINKGHTLVIPKQHYETTLDMPADKLCEMMKIVHKCAAAIVNAVKPDGYNVFINNKKAAGQEVPPAHLHIAPRHKGDFEFHWPHQKYDEGEMDEYLAKIKESL